MDYSIEKTIEDYSHVINEFKRKNMNSIADMKIKELKEILEKYVEKLD